MKRLANPNSQDKPSNEYVLNCHIEQVSSQLVMLITQLIPSMVTKDLKVIG